MFPALFNLPLEQGVRYKKYNRSIKLEGYGTLLVYANDIVILWEFQDQIILSTFKLTETRQSKGLTINEKQKTPLCPDV